MSRTPSPTTYATLICVMTLLAGCAGPAGVTPPATPAGSGQFSLPPTAAGIPLALVHLRVDPSQGTAEVSPLRLNEAVGDAYLVGLNNLRREFRVKSIRRQPGPNGAQLVLACEFQHPFPAAVRPDLMGWDLKAILATDLNATSFPGATETLPADVLANAEGYTGEWTPEITAVLPSLTSTAFPYVILGEDKTAPASFDYRAPAGYNCFPPGSVAQGSLVLNLPTATPIDFDLFFTVGYEVSATKATRLSPDYQPPRGNARAPWRAAS